MIYFRDAPKAQPVAYPGTSKSAAKPSKSSPQKRVTSPTKTTTTAKARDKDTVDNREAQLTDAMSELSLKPEAERAIKDQEESSGTPESEAKETGQPMEGEDVTTASEETTEKKPDLKEQGSIDVFDETAAAESGAGASGAATSDDVSEEAAAAGGDNGVSQHQQKGRLFFTSLTVHPLL